jgi:hypothetical protein
MTYKCKICGKEFDNSRSLDAHYHVHGGVDGDKDSTKCSCIYSKKVVLVSYLETHISKLSNCICCGKKTSTSFNKYCSSSCAATVNNKFRTPRNSVGIETSSSLKDNYSTNPHGPYTLVSQCKVCGKWFPKTGKRLTCSDTCAKTAMGVRLPESDSTAKSSNTTKTKKSSYNRPTKPPYSKVSQCKECGKWFHNTTERSTCSTKCARAIISRTATNNPNFGGNQNNHAYGWYDSPFAGRVWLESSYEYRVAKDLDDHGIPWIRPPYMHYVLNGLKKKYFADFYLPDQDIYLDPKNDWIIPKDIPKINQAMLYNNVIIHILTKDQLSWAAIQELL